MKGLFISFEGLDGSGKSTALSTAIQYLKLKKIDSVQTREPGGTPFAERMRDGLKHGFYGIEDEKLSPLVQALLMNAARADHLEKVILPNLEEGKWVLTDRFYESTMAYQGGAGGLDLGLLNTLHHTLHKGIYPDITFLFDGDPQVLSKRMQGREGKPDLLDQLQLGKAERMREVYHSLYRANKAAYHLIDAEQGIIGVWDQIQARLDQLIQERHGNV